MSKQNNCSRNEMFKIRKIELKNINKSGEISKSETYSVTMPKKLVEVMPDLLKIYWSASFVNGQIIMTSGSYPKSVNEERFTMNKIDKMREHFGKLL